MSDQELKYDLVKEIHIKYNPKIVDFLEANNYTFKIKEIQDFTPYQFENEINNNLTQDFISILIPKHLYKDLEMLCKVKNIDTNEKLIEILETALKSAELDNF